MGMNLGIMIGIGSGYGGVQQLLKMKAAIAAVVAQTPGARARWGAVGNSVTAGAGALGVGSATTANANRAKSLVGSMRSLMSSKGLPVRSDAIWGNAFLGTATVAGYTLYNPDLVFSGSFTLSAAGTTSIGGRFFTLPASTTGTMTFTPQENADSIEVGFSFFSGLGTFTVSDSSGILATIDTHAASGSYGITTVTRAANSKDPFIIARAAGGTNPNGEININALVPYSTVEQKIELWNMGWIGSKASDWAGGSSFGAGNAVKKVTADMWSTELGANDANASVSAATYKTNLGTVLANVATLNSPDRLLIEVHPTDPVTAFNIPQSYRDAMADLSATNSLLPPPDFSLAGLVLADHSDSIHLLESGYIKEAAYLYDAVKQPLGLPA